MVHHWQLKCLFNSLFQITAKEHQSSALLALFWGKPPVTSGFSLQKANDVECIFALWHHHNNHKHICCMNIDISDIVENCTKSLHVHCLQMLIYCLCGPNTSQKHFLLDWPSVSFEIAFFYLSFCFFILCTDLVFDWLIYWNCDNLMSSIFIGRYLKLPSEMPLNIHYRHILSQFFLNHFLNLIFPTSISNVLYDSMRLYS